MYEVVVPHSDVLLILHNSVVKATVIWPAKKDFFVDKSAAMQSLPETNISDALPAYFFAQESNGNTVRVAAWISNHELQNATH